MQLTIATPPSTNFIMGGWQQAGNVLRVEGEGPWMVEMPEMWKGTPSEELVMKDMCKENGDEWPHGDRRQELVFIGHNMKHEAIQKALDQCLLTDEEMELGREKWEETMAEVDKIQLSLEEEEEDDEDEEGEDDDEDEEDEDDSKEDTEGTPSPSKRPKRYSVSHLLGPQIQATILILHNTHTCCSGDLVQRKARL